MRSCDVRVTGVARRSALAERLRLMLITDPSSGRRLEERVERAVLGGVTAVQVRIPGGTAREIHDLALGLRRPVREGGALLLVNHHADAAVAVDADGVHLKRISLLRTETRATTSATGPG